MQRRRRNSPTGVVVADVNGDGKLDVVAANSNNNTISLLLGNGDGTLQTATSYAIGSSPRGLVTGRIRQPGQKQQIWRLSTTKATM